ncbi:MAG: fibrobacter succinogenes major paralogous domain-containing protein, partial [Bacteroidetes bacterium]|nr:fibrobacter succinogenes major paralogous domain-containing protein [Bacteroidota bacterium]
TTPAAGVEIGEAGGWDATIPTGTIWEKANDPSPKGWRVPTLQEQQSLFDTEKVTNEWTTQNGITGRKFTDRTTGISLFLPAVGNRSRSAGELRDAGVYGVYWISTPDEVNDGGDTRAYDAYFTEGYVRVGTAGRNYGLSVRSVLAE